MKFDLNKLSIKLGLDIKYTSSGGFWMLLGQTVSSLALLITSIIFVNVLDETQYGIYKYILGVAAILSAFSLTGISQSITQTAAKGYDWFFYHGIKWYSYSLVLFFTLGFAGSVYYFIQDNQILAIGLLIITLTQPVSNVFQQIVPYLNGKGEFRKSNTILIIRNTLVSLLSIFALFLTDDILVLVFVYFGTQMFINLGEFLFYRKTIPKNNEFDVSIEKKYWSYSIHTSIRNLFSNFSHRLDVVLIFQRLTAAELAIYSVAMLLPEQLKGALKNVATLITPKYSNYNDYKKLRRSVFVRSLQYFFLVLIIAIIYAIAAELVFKIIFPKYEESIFFTQLLAFSLPATTWIVPRAALQTQLFNKELYYVDIVGSVFLIVILLISIPIFGLLGAVFSRIIYRYLMMSMTFFFFFSASKTKIT